MVVLIMAFVHIEELYDIVDISIPKNKISCFVSEIKINQKSHLIGQST